MSALGVCLIIINRFLLLVCADMKRFILFALLLSHARAEVIDETVNIPSNLFWQTSTTNNAENYDPDALCPKSWVQYLTSCYRFIRSPIKTRDDARMYCRGFNSDLASVNSMEEHSFIVTYLQKNDPSHRIWYISGRQQSPGIWVNDGDSTTMMNMESAFLPNQETVYDKDLLAYGYSLTARQWGLLRVDGRDPLLYICEIPVNRVSFLSFFFLYELDHIFILFSDD